jgi:hypothetical protein
VLKSQREKKARPNAETGGQVFWSAPGVCPANVNERRKVWLRCIQFAFAAFKAATIDQRLLLPAANVSGSCQI